MSNNSLGDITSGQAQTMTVNANEAITAGDFVAGDQSASDDRRLHIVQLDNGDANEDQVLGVALEDFSNDDNGTILIDGTAIANVESVSQGERLGSGSTAGRAASEDGGNAVALSDAGGTDSAGTNLSANEAEVKV